MLSLRPHNLAVTFRRKVRGLTRRDVVVGIRRGPIALVEEVLDIELRFPGLGDLRVDAGVYIQHALPVVQQQLLNAGIRLAKIIVENF